MKHNINPFFFFFVLLFLIFIYLFIYIIIDLKGIENGRSQKFCSLCAIEFEFSKNIQGLLEEKLWIKKINECVLCVHVFLVKNMPLVEIRSL